VALVTGVSQGIGLATAELLIAEGVEVFGVSRTAPADRPDIAHVALDMSEPDAGERAVAACVERYGRLDVLVNNVGIGLLSPGFAAEDDSLWQRIWELNVMSLVRTTRAAMPHLIEAHGVVVNVSSLNGDLPEPGIYAYSAGKAAMDNITTNLSKEFAPRGVRIVGVAPGPVSTPLWLGPDGAAAQISAMAGGDPAEIVRDTEAQIPIGRFATALEIGAAIVFLASPRSGSTTGTTLRIDGGLTPTL
jgi:NAD(P)-dependent dehydrogenase (short-subunit alcohol dehydrogenase family)